MNLWSSHGSWKVSLHQTLPNLSFTFQLQTELSYFIFSHFMSDFPTSGFPTSVGFQLQHGLSNFILSDFMSYFPIENFLLLVISNCHFQLHVSPYRQHLTAVQNWTQINFEEKNKFLNRTYFGTLEMNIPELVFVRRKECCADSEFQIRGPGGLNKRPYRGYLSRASLDRI